MLKQINEATDFILSKHSFKPTIGIILGTGLSSLADEIEIECELNYIDIPHFQVSTVESHKGKLLLGKLSEKQVVVMQGRFHYYEGYSMQQITFPIRVMKQLGINTLFISNASGGLNRNFNVSDLMIINDHINLLPEHPLRGKNYEELGPRFPDMSTPYNKNLIELAKKIAIDNNILLHEGKYVAVQGPTLETKAEYKMLHLMRADAVGMSTVPEVIVARHANMKVFGITVITDLGFPEILEPTTLEKVIAAAQIAEPKMTILMKELIKAIQ